MGIVLDYNAQDMYNNIVLHASLGKTYNLPVVITTSTDQGNSSLVFFSGGTTRLLISLCI